MLQIKRKAIFSEPRVRPVSRSLITKMDPTQSTTVLDIRFSRFKWFKSM